MKNANRFHPSFPDDLVAATESYDRISGRLGNRSCDNVRNTLGTIRRRPESFGFVSERLRAAMVKSFPYVILYRFVDRTVFLVGLFHAASDPKRWTDRDAESGPPK